MDQFGGVCQSAQIDQFEKFSTITCTKSKFKGGQFYEKKCQPLYFGPHIVGRFWHIGGSANRPRMVWFENFSTCLTQNPHSKGVHFIKKNANSCIWGPILRAVLKNGGSANRPRMDRFENFSTFSYTKSELKGGLFYERNCQLMYLGPYNAGRFRQMGVSANRPKLDQFWCLRTFSYTKSKFKGGIFYEKNCHLILLGPHVAGRFGQTHGCRPAKYGPINFFWSFWI